MAGEFFIQSRQGFQINTTPESTETLAVLAGGISSVEPANNEEVDQTKYLDGNGFSESDVIGAQMTLAFSGHRKYGDAAQDYIFSKQTGLGSARRTTFTWTEPDGGEWTGPITIANISGPSGEAGAKGEISFEIHFNGQPSYTPPTP